MLSDPSPAFGIRPVAAALSFLFILTDGAALLITFPRERLACSIRTEPWSRSLSSESWSWFPDVPAPRGHGVGSVAEPRTPAHPTWSEKHDFKDSICQMRSTCCGVRCKKYLWKMPFSDDFSSKISWQLFFFLILWNVTAYQWIFVVNQYKDLEKN